MVENKLSLIVYFNENPNLEEFHPFRKKLKLKNSWTKLFKIIPSILNTLNVRISNQFFSFPI